MATSSFSSRRKFMAPSLLPLVAAAPSVLPAGVGNSLKVLASHAPGARVLDTGLVMQADQERATMERVNDWLGKLDKVTP